MKERIFLATLFIAILASMLLASTADELQQAAKLGKAAFVLVKDPNTIGTEIESAWSKIQDAMKLAKGSVLIELDRNDDANADLVARYRLSGAPLPVILVITPDGIISGGVEGNKATPEMLANMVPSPKMSQILKAIDDGNAVFITAYRKKMTMCDKVLASCEDAVKKMQGKAVLIKIDMNDKSETQLLNMLKINVGSDEPVTMVGNQKGQIAATFTGEVNADDLVQATKKKVGGCCPSKVTGGGGSCAPKK